MTGLAAAVRVSGDIYEVTEDHVAEVDRVLTILRGLRRTEAAARAHLLECEPDEAAWKEFCRGRDRQGDEQ